jgi:hypothetical protein
LPFEFDDMFDPLVVGFVLAAALLAVAAYTRGWRPGSDFVIRYRGGGDVRVRGQVPLGKAALIREFFARDLRPSGGVTVHGRYGAKRALKLSISGALSAGQRQRVRNFLLEHLR